jgi:uracil-DNA glycosylase
LTVPRVLQRAAAALARPAAAPGGPSNRLREKLPDLLRRVAPDWQSLVQRWSSSQAGQSLIGQIEARRAAGATIFPAEPLRALALTPLASVRVVILGQDPYHGAEQAEGLAFSVPQGQRPPPSLRNILAELQRDLGVVRSNPSLENWARQGVLLLNTVLTVEEGRPASHASMGWEALTDEIIKTLSTSDRSVVFMLWGAHAASKRRPLDQQAAQRHLVLTANHPSPLSARRAPVPFLGCGHFGQATRFLAAVNARQPPIDWHL